MAGRIQSAASLRTGDWSQPVAVPSSMLGLLGCASWRILTIVFSIIHHAALRRWAVRPVLGVIIAFVAMVPVVLGLSLEWHEVSGNRNRQTRIDKSRPPWDKDW